MLWRRCFPFLLALVRPRSYLPMMLIRPKSIHVNNERKFNEPDFDRLFSLSTKDGDLARALILPLRHWFIYETPRRNGSMRAKRTRSKLCWMLVGNWAINGEYGATNAKGMITSLNTLRTFVDELEAVHASLDSQSSDT